MHTEEAIWQKLDYIASLLERDLESNGWTGKTVTLTFKLDTFQGMQIITIVLHHSLDIPPSFYSEEVLYKMDIKERRSCKSEYILI